MPFLGRAVGGGEDVRRCTVQPLAPESQVTLDQRQARHIQRPEPAGSSELREVYHTWVNVKVAQPPVQCKQAVPEGGDLDTWPEYRLRKQCPGHTWIEKTKAAPQRIQFDQFVVRWNFKST